MLKLQFDGTSTQNNGSMREQKITVPTVGSNPGFTATQTYTYDNLNRIQTAAEVIGGQTWKQTFIIDRYGNREFDPNSANTTTLGSCVTAICNPDIRPSDNRFSDGQGYSYDSSGNVTQDATSQRFTYDAENHQKEFFNASNPGGTPDATYHYGGDGRRVKKVSNTETTVFVYDGSGTLVAEYSTALATVQQVSYLTTGHLGSPRITTDQNGKVTNRKDFAAFGDEIVSSQRVGGADGNGYEPSSPTRKDYTGYEKDQESGLEFAQARYYNPTQGRFTSVDPMTASASIKNPQTFNRYSYVLNSPYKFSDPLGLIPETTGACGTRCSNSGPWVDGSAFRGTDTSFGSNISSYAPENQSNAAGSTPVNAATTAAANSTQSQQTQTSSTTPQPTTLVAESSSFIVTNSPIPLPSDFATDERVTGKGTIVIRQVKDQNGNPMDESTGVEIKEKLSPEPGNSKAIQMFKNAEVVQQSRSLPLDGGISVDCVCTIGPGTVPMSTINDKILSRSGAVIRQDIKITMPKKFLGLFRYRKTVLRQTNTFTYNERGVRIDFGQVIKK